MSSVRILAAAYLPTLVLSQQGPQVVNASVVGERDTISSYVIAGLCAFYGASISLCLLFIRSRQICCRVHAKNKAGARVAPVQERYRPTQSLTRHLAFRKDRGARLGIFLVDGNGLQAGKVIVHNPGQLDDGRLRPGDIIDAICGVPIKNAEHASSLIVTAGPVLELSVTQLDRLTAELDDGRTRAWSAVLKETGGGEELHSFAPPDELRASLFKPAFKSGRIPSLKRPQSPMASLVALSASFISSSRPSSRHSSSREAKQRPNQTLGAADASGEGICSGSDGACAAVELQRFGRSRAARQTAAEKRADVVARESTARGVRHLQRFSRGWAARRFFVSLSTEVEKRRAARKIYRAYRNFKGRQQFRAEWASQMLTVERLDLVD